MKIEICSLLTISLFEEEYVELNVSENQVTITTELGKIRTIRLPWKIKPNIEDDRKSKGEKESGKHQRTDQEERKEVKAVEPMIIEQEEITGTPKDPKRQIFAELFRLNGKTESKKASTKSVPNPGPSTPMTMYTKTREQLNEDRKFALEEVERIDNTFRPKVHFAEKVIENETHSDLKKLFEQVRDLSMQGYDSSSLQDCCRSFYLDERILQEYSGCDIKNSKESEFNLADRVTVEIIERYANTISQMSKGTKKQVITAFKFAVLHKILRIRGKWKN